MKELLIYYRLNFLPYLLQDALQETPRNYAKVAYLRQQVYNLKIMYNGE